MALDFSIKESAILSSCTGKVIFFFFEIAFEHMFTSLSLHHDFNDLCKKKNERFYKPRMFGIKRVEKGTFFDGDNFSVNTALV